ncbi:MAG: hypothetical protein IPM22_14845 [Betaproteobacteria bacterium]|nr:hypothetical protein [Betaproteobacteria bacterium]
MKKKITLPVTGFDPVPSLTQYAQVAVRVVRSAPPDADAVGIPVAEDGAVPKALGLDRATLAAAGFDGKVGQALLVPKADGPLLVAVGVGKANRADASARRGRGVRARPPRVRTSRRRCPTPAASSPRSRRRRWSKACCSPAIVTTR